MGLFADPAKMVVECTQPANVDTVVVDGRVLKRDGKLTHIDPVAVIDTARRSLAAVRKRANWI
jgi:cytosine/adenosine deaminase-related metal-dependent hydrolase